MPHPTKPLGINLPPPPGGEELSGSDAPKMVPALRWRDEPPRVEEVPGLFLCQLKTGGGVQAIQVTKRDVESGAYTKGPFRWCPIPEPEEPNA